MNANDCWVYHPGTNTVMDGNEVELLPKTDWSVCECGELYDPGHADTCHFCRKGI